MRLALACAALAGGLRLMVAWCNPISELEPDLRPAMHWPEPVLSDAHEPGERGSVTVTVEYLIEPAQRQGFLAALHAFAPERLRDGAMQWDVFEDGAHPVRFVEVFLLPSWDDHLRHHARVSHADASCSGRCRSSTWGHGRRRWSIGLDKDVGWREGMARRTPGVARLAAN